MDQILGQVLRRAVWERLDLLDELADRADSRSLASVVRTEMPRLTSGWRAVLAAHEADERGHCPECSTRWHPRPAPCSVWRNAHELLVAAESATSSRRPVRVGAPAPMG